jgi:hypothetical protein
VFSTILSSIAGKIAIAGVALATTTGGLAAADALPEPAQQVVSDAAARIGISLPAPDNTPDQTDELVAPELPDEASNTARQVIELVFGSAPDQTDESVAPELPDEASSTAGRVIEILFGADPATEGPEFGRRVADSASEGNSQGGGKSDNETPEGVPSGPPEQIPAGPPSD